MSQDHAFTDLMTRLRAGEQQAATEVFNRFSGRLIGLARKFMESELRRKVEPEDVLQSACKSFFHRHGKGQFELASWGDLWAILTVITLRKCANLKDRFQADRRNVYREVSLSALASEMSRVPSAFEAAVLAETVQCLLRGVSDAERKVVTLSMQGYTAAEIAVQLGWSVRTVQLCLKKVRKELEDELNSGQDLR